MTRKRYAIFLLVLFAVSVNQSQLKAIKTGDTKIISVNTFEDRSIGTTTYNAFKNGIPSQITETMMLVPNIKVIDRDKVIRTVLKNKELEMLGLIEEGSSDNEPLIEMGKMLKAEYVVTGFFMVFKKGLQISATVLDIESSEVILKASVKGEVSNFFILQQEIAVKIVEGLNVKLNPDEKNRMIESYDTRNLNAYINNFRGEQKLEEIIIIIIIDKDTELRELRREKEKEEKRNRKEIHRLLKQAERENMNREKEIAALREKELSLRRKNRMKEAENIQEKIKELEERKNREMRNRQKEIKRIQELAQKRKENYEKGIEDLEKMDLNKKDISHKKKEAENLFKKSLKSDSEYKRAKKNLAKLIQGIPVTL